MPETKVALVIGAGDATGGAVARRFAREGFFACVTRRHGDKLIPLVERIERDGGKARAFGSDARREEDVTALFEIIERDIGPIEVVSFNVGGNVRFPIRETTTRVYTKVWEMCALSGFLAGRAAAQVMVPRQRGTILLTGATASVRGGAGYAAFAGGKHALRALAQSMARGTRPRRHPCRACRRRWCHRYRLHSAAGTGYLRGKKGGRRHPQSGIDRGELLDAAHAAARRLDP